MGKVEWKKIITQSEDKMKITIFKLKSNPEIGFSIHEDFENKYNPATKKLVKTRNKSYQLWIDPYEGGEAYESD